MPTRQKELGCPRRIIEFAFLLVLAWSLPLYADERLDTQIWLRANQSFENESLAFSVQRPTAPGSTGLSTPKLNGERTRLYVFEPGAPAVFQLPANCVPRESEGSYRAKLARWAGSSWEQRGLVTMRQVSEGVALRPGIDNEGFYRFEFIETSGPDNGQAMFAHILVLDSWKRSFFAYCRQGRESVELHPDPELYRSSLAASHWDHAMELASTAGGLTGELLGAIARGIESNQEFGRGGCPGLVMGCNKIRLKRFPGDSTEEFLVFVPDTYKPAQSWPLLLHTDKMRWWATDDYDPNLKMVEVFWHTIKDASINWKAYQAIEKLLLAKLNIDENRIFIHGYCANGFAAMSMALTYPDHWAGCNVVFASTKPHLAGNALNLRMIFTKGPHDEPSYVPRYLFGLKYFQFGGCRYLEYDTSDRDRFTRGTELPTGSRDERPTRIFHTIESRVHQKAYWVEILAREDENFVGSIDVCVAAPHQVTVQTNNVNGYRLELTRAPVDPNSPVEIIENGHSVGVCRDPVFSRFPRYHTESPYAKNGKVHGPIRDVFSDPFIVIYAQGTTDKESEHYRNIAVRLARGAPCMPYSETLRGDLSSHNIIMVGFKTPEPLFKGASKGFPLAIRGEKVTSNAGSVLAEENAGYVAIYPNPANEEKYIVIHAATSAGAMVTALGANQELLERLDTDVAVYRVADDGSLRWPVRENLGSLWNWQAEYEQVVATTRKKHFEWQWNQWLGAVLKESTQADIVICENILVAPHFLAPGAKTYRDFYNAFKNELFVKARVKGKTLKRMVFSPLDEAKNDLPPTVVGIAFFKQSSGSESGTISLDELKADGLYEVVLPASCLRTNRFGIVMTDYVISDGLHLLPVLKRYFADNDHIDLTAHLDRLTVNIF